MSYHAWYSAGADKKHGHVIYRDKNGLEIKCTEVSSKPEPCGKWNDAIYVGEVETFVSSTINIDWDVSPAALLNQLQDLMAEKKRCEAQYPSTGNCFCYTYPIKRYAN